MESLGTERHQEEVPVIPRSSNVALPSSQDSTYLLAVLTPRTREVATGRGAADSNSGRGPRLFPEDSMSALRVL